MKNKKMLLYFVTSNKFKVKEFKLYFGKNFEIKQIKIEYPELRSDDPKEIASLAAKQLAEKLNKTIMVEDSGLFIKALNDFPGTCSSYIHKRIGLEGILKLMGNIKERTAYYKSAVAYCEPGKKAVSFLGEEKGIIAEKNKGKYGFGHDPIFIPEGSKKTYGQIKDCEKIKKFRKRAVEKLKQYLENKGE
jgi:XTP/dITP diphosphohydrolase